MSGQGAVHIYTSDNSISQYLCNVIIHSSECIIVCNSLAMAIICSNNQYVHCDMYIALSSGRHCFASKYSPGQEYLNKLKSVPQVACDRDTCATSTISP